MPDRERYAGQVAIGPDGPVRSHDFCLQGAPLSARPSGALWWPEQRVLVVSDLHFGKSERLARRGGALLPPYETRATLQRLQDEIDALRPAHVVCLGDSFDDLAAATALEPSDRLWLLRLMAGRDWTWIEGNHDAGPVDLGANQRSELLLGPLIFRHHPGGAAEVAGHYHPKLRLAGRSHRCFLIDRNRVILPAFGAYTGGMWADQPPLAGLMQPDAIAVLVGGARALAVPLFPAPRRRAPAP